MSATITALFSQRRDAEMAIEHLVQEHGIDRNAIAVEAASDANTVGTEVAGGDVESGYAKTGSDGEAALNGKIKVSADIGEADITAVKKSLETYGGIENPS